MQHAGARQIIPRLLAGSSLGDHALLVMLGGDLQELLPGTLSDGLSQRLAQLPSDEAPACACVQNQAAIPAHESELLAQLAPQVVANPSDTGLNIALLAGLADLWPHVASGERPLLRTRFYNGLMARAEAVGQRDGVPREALVTAAELKVWNRYMPTATGEASAAELPKLLGAATAQKAYHLLTDHLIGGMDLSVLARVLGSLAVQVADQRADPTGLVLHPLIGAVAASRLVALAAPEDAAALLAQLAHQVWWSANLAGLLRRSGEEPSSESLEGAILSGAASAARRRARTLQLDDAGWWNLLTPVILGLSSGAQTAGLLRSVGAAWTLAVRSNQRLMAPDDLAAVAAILADHSS